jgi:glycerate kinase
VITGEGALDEQSLQGKAPVSVARWSREAGVRCIAIAGSISLTRTQLLSAGFDEWRALCGDSPGAEMAGGEDIAEAVKALVNKGSGRR